MTSKDSRSVKCIICPLQLIGGISYAAYASALFQSLHIELKSCSQLLLETRKTKFCNNLLPISLGLGRNGLLLRRRTWYVHVKFRYWDIISHRMSPKTFWSKIFPTMITPNGHVISLGPPGSLPQWHHLSDTLSQVINFTYSLSVIEISQSYDMTLLEINFFAQSNDGWVYNWAYWKSQIMTNKFVMTVIFDRTIRMNFVCSLHAYEVHEQPTASAFSSGNVKLAWVCIIMRSTPIRPNRTRFQSQWHWLYGLDSGVQPLVGIHCIKN